jgi:hypothetical protein
MAPTPVEKSLDLFNKAVALQLGDVEAAKALQFQLLSELRRQPSNPGLQVAMSKACRIVGERDLALKHLHLADSQWGKADVIDQAMIANQWTDLGQAEKSRQRTMDLARHTDAMADARNLWNIALAAMFCGDIVLLSRAAASEQAAQHPPFAHELLTGLRELDLETDFAAVQKVMGDVVRDCAMKIGVGIAIHPDDCSPYVAWTVYIDGSKIHRWQVSDRLNDELGALFKSTGRHLDDWWWRYRVVVTAAPRLSSIPGVSKPKFAA